MKKLGVTTLVAIVAVLSRYFVWANLTNQTSENDAIRPNFPETNAIQTSNALAIMDQVRREGLGTQGCLVGLVAGLAETGLLVYANKNVHNSWKIKHDFLLMGSKHDGVGIYLHRARKYRDLNAIMDPAQSASLFFARMKRIEGWETMPIPKLCRTIQGAAHNDRYKARMVAAKRICALSGFYDRLEWGTPPSR